MSEITVLTRNELSEIARQAAMVAVMNLREETAPAPIREIMTKKELAEYLRCDISKINRFMKKGLPYFMFGETPRFRKTAVDEWLENQ